MSFAPKTAPEFHEERAALIAELYANISLGNGVMEGTPETQAFLWLGDAGCLRALVEESRESPRVARSLLGGALQSTRVADTWLANTRESKSKRGQKRKAILGEEGTEHPRNMLSLAPHVHKYWGKALFALKPLEQLDDGKSLTAEFHWLKQRTGEKSVTLTEMPTLATAIDSPGCCIKLWNNRTEQKIVTGHQVVFRTDDSIEHPLPSWELLEMQWHLQRVAAMAGASEQDDEDDLSVSDQAGVGELSDAESSDNDCDGDEDDSDEESDSDSDNDDGGDDHSFPSARRQSLSSSTRRASLSPSRSHPNHPPSPQLMNWTSNLPSRPAPLDPSAQPDPLAAPQENVPPTPRQTRRRDSNKQESPTREDSRLRRPLR